MGNICWGRVFLGGLLAGLVMNIGEAALHSGVLGESARALLEKCGIAAESDPVQMSVLVLMTFVLGIAAVWLYAAIRPRYGPGPKTALCAGLAVWLFAHLWSGVYLGIGYGGLFTPKLAWLPVVWGFFEAPIGTLVGAWVYRE
jgi:hypothetical protein